MLPAVLDPWAGHALFEAAHLAAERPGSKVWLVSLGPEGQAAAGDDDGGAEGPVRAGGARWSGLGGFTDSFETAAALAEAIAGHPGPGPPRLLLFGGWESASRGAGATMQMVGERLGITDQFQGVDQLDRRATTAAFEILERIEGGTHQVSVCAAPPAVLGWATGNLPEPRNNPQVGMANMRTIMPALQRAKAAPSPMPGLRFAIGDPAQAAARDAHREGHAGRRDRARNRRLDRGGITWKPFSFSLTPKPTARWPRPRLEALTAALALGRRR